MKNIYVGIYIEKYIWWYECIYAYVFPVKYYTSTNIYTETYLNHVYTYSHMFKHLKKDNAG